MKRIYIAIIMFVSIPLLMFLGCENDYPESIYNADADLAAAPVITAIEPADGSFSAIGIITITGENFSAVKEKNHVYVAGIEATLLEASATQLKVKVPNIWGDSLRIKIRIDGGVLWGDFFPYPLERVSIEYGGFDEYDDLYGIDMDNDENLYVASTAKVIEKVTPGTHPDGYEGISTVLGNSTLVRVTAMKIGPGKNLFLARNSNALYRMAVDGTAAVKWATAPGKIYDLDFSATGVMYAGGSNDDLYRILPDASGIAIASYPDTYIKAIRVFDGYVYVGGEINSTKERFIWRHQIISDNQLGDREVYFDWTAKINLTADVLSITFAADGDMYVGTNGADAIVVVHPDRTFEPLYAGAIEAATYAMTWGSDKYLYVNRRNEEDATKKRIIRLNMRKAGAPYYGRLL